MIIEEILDYYKSITFFYNDGVLFNSDMWPPMVKDLHEMAKSDGILCAEKFYNHFHIDDVTEEVDYKINEADQRSASVEIYNFWRIKLDAEYGKGKIAIEVRDCGYSCYLVVYTSSIELDIGVPYKICISEIEAIKFHPETGITLNDQLFEWQNKRIAFDMSGISEKIEDQYQYALKLWFGLRKVIDESFPNWEVEIDLCDFCDKIALRILEHGLKERQP